MKQLPQSPVSNAIQEKKENFKYLRDDRKNGYLSQKKMLSQNKQRIQAQTKYPGTL